MDLDPGLRLVGRLLLRVGVLIAAAGGLLLLAGRIPWLGQLPGDFGFKTGRVTVLVPLGTSILLSVVLTIVLNLLLRR